MPALNDLISQILERAGKLANAMKMHHRLRRRLRPRLVGPSTKSRQP
jgi:hypothetical protein